MTTSRSLPRNAAAALCAAVFALGVAACGSAPSGAGTTQTTHVTPAPALTKVDAPTAPAAPTREPRCFPGKHCQ